LIDLILTNRKCIIEGADPEVIRQIDGATSYTVAGHWFSPAFRARRWDGKERLLTYSHKDGHHVPAGLYLDVLRVLKTLGAEFRVTKRTHVRHSRVRLRWNDDVVMRGYQKRAVNAVLKCPHAGVGLLKMPIRSGKTKTASRLIYKVGRPTLFLVPSQMLLRQTHAAIRECLPDVEVGLIGDGENETGFITIATLQSLARLRAGLVPAPRRHPKAPKPSAAQLKQEAKARAKKSREMKLRYKALCDAFDLVIVDEAHHIRGEGEWYKILYEMDARFKVGLSATAYPESEAEAERGIIWMRGTCGPIRVDVPTSELVEAGYLMRQNVRMFRVTTPNMNGMKWSNTLRQRCVTQNKKRNRLIVRLAQKYVADGCKVLIVANRFDHIDALVALMEDASMDFRVVTGRDKGDDRDSKVEDFVNGLCSVLIGTVLGEGVDIPVVDIVINAEGGKDDKATVQRQRNLTISPGKKRAVLIDFLDETNGYFAKHSKQRLEAYRAEPSFSVKVIG
jgi:superfamily II DNA or RNA helicase